MGSSRKLYCRLAKNHFVVQIADYQLFFCMVNRMVNFQSSGFPHNFSKTNYRLHLKMRCIDASRRQLHILNLVCFYCSPRYSSTKFSTQYSSTASRAHLFRLLVLSCNISTRVHATASCIACMMHFKSKISKSISRYKLSRRFYDLVTILLGYKARCCVLNHLSTVMLQKCTTANRCGT